MTEPTVKLRRIQPMSITREISFYNLPLLPDAEMSKTKERYILEFNLELEFASGRTIIVKQQEVVTPEWIKQNPVMLIHAILDSLENKKVK